MSTTRDRTENIVQDSTLSEKLNLANAVYVERSFFDLYRFSAAKSNKNIRWNDFLFSVSNAKTFFFNGDSIKVYEVDWMNDSLGYPEFSNSILFSKKYGVLFKTFRRMGKEWYRWRLVELKCADGKSLSLDEFTKALTRDPEFFPQPTKHL